METEGFLKSRMRENRTYGSVRGSDIPSHLINEKGASSCLLDGHIMEYRQFGKTGVQVSPLGFGMMRLPKTEDGKIDREAAIRNVRRAIDRGLNYVDTAYNYHEGESEVVTGEALLDGYRERVFLATKCPVWKLSETVTVADLLEEQLQKLQTDHVDFYLLHALSRKRWEETVLPLGAVEQMLEARRAGKVRYVGFSFHDDLETFKEIIDYTDQWDFCQIQLNYVDTGHQAGLEGLQYAASRGLGVVIMEPLRGGYLANLPENVEKTLSTSGKSPVEMAFDFLWDRPEVSLLLSGMSTFQQVEDNMSYAARSGIGMLTEEERNIFPKAEELLRACETVPCTGCNYCSVCPQGIAIPQIFEAYNNCRKNMSLFAGKEGYKKAAETGALANDCVGCGACEAQCPQQLPISQWMPRIHDLLK